MKLNRQRFIDRAELIVISPNGSELLALSDFIDSWELLAPINCDPYYREMSFYNREMNQFLVIVHLKLSVKVKTIFHESEFQRNGRK